MGGSEDKDWKGCYSFVCRTKVVIEVIYVDDDEGALAPHIDNENQNSWISFPAGEYLVDESTCRSTIVLRIKFFGPRFNDNSLCNIVAEDFFSYLR